MNEPKYQCGVKACHVGGIFPSKSELAAHYAEISLNDIFFPDFRQAHSQMLDSMVMALNRNEERKQA